MPQISVIVPVYKVEEYLSRCVDSILAQTFTDFELILVDDGSPDNCGKLCDEYAKKDARIRVIHQKNMGVSAARNTGIDWAFQNSDSQWLAFIDSDDWVHPQYLELLLYPTNTHDVDVSICEYEETSALAPFEAVTPQSYMELSSEDFYIRNEITSVVPWGKLYKKTCFETVRYPVGKRYEDEATTYKILFQKQYVSYLNEKLYFYYTNLSGFMKSEWSPTRLDAITAHEEQIVFFRKNGYINALKKVEIILLWYIVAQIDITLNNNKYSSYAHGLKKKLRNCIKEYKKDLNLSFKSHTGIYEKAYPKLTKAYWLVNAVLNKLKNTRR